MILFATDTQLETLFSSEWIFLDGTFDSCPEQSQLPMYLKQSPSIVIKTLSKALNFTFKEKGEKTFICIRLSLLDQYYCLQLQQQLWNSYLDVGIQQQLLPDRLYMMAKSNDFEVCRRYLVTYITDLKKQMDQCKMELIKQSQLCPITTLSLDRIDQYLNEFVDCQRNYLSTRNSRQLIKFNNDFHEKELFKTISGYRLTFDQVSLYDF
ncbi:unnamed protein product [Rotaria sordida]|uniref:Uncharacterized protein n=1 Tax=Rotaria sordida TaxID=392033 RepID=A0A815AFX1_9BILA|nr:unnamed protein product [Rotaria sordida]CAF1255345.1 unnamed protein product [Rotaria sordida]CAF4046430.1 unnamed protein product [Rotaria sordida]CAF4171755.1 unnamed protein product [Rotaria sordida]